MDLLRISKIKGIFINIFWLEPGLDESGLFIILCFLGGGRIGMSVLLRLSSVFNFNYEKCF